MSYRIPLHTLVYGDSGSGKSTFAATFPKPMLVFSFDPRGKEIPYLTHGATVDDGHNTNVVEKDTGKLLTRVERYGDPGTDWTAYSRFQERMATFAVEYPMWRTVVIDSVTYMELAARKQQQYILNPSSRDPRQWYGGSTEQLEEMLMIRFGSLPMNVVVVAHIDEDKDEVHGTYVRNPSAPGRMRKRMASGFPEFYRAYCQFVGENNERVFRLQTVTSKLYQASSQIHAPDDCTPHYENLWAKWQPIPPYTKPTPQP